jgi:hypothetical protein
MSGSVVMQKSIFQDGQLAAIFEVWSGQNFNLDCTYYTSSPSIHIHTRFEHSTSNSI